MWIDTHCHLDAGEFDPDRDRVVASAKAASVRAIVVPAVEKANFTTVRALAHRFQGAYALGIHPLFTGRASDADIDALRDEIARSMQDPRFVGIGEIGLDYFVPELDDARQRFFFDAQLRLARDFDLPVICHVRRSQDQVLHGLRRYGLHTGIAHAFNGSQQQADFYLKQGFKLGFGGAMTFERAKQIRRLACALPDESIVLETDAPDISPAWRYKQRNEPGEIARIAEVLGSLRGMPIDRLAECTTANAFIALPRLRAALG